MEIGNSKLQSTMEIFPLTPVCEGITFIVAYGKLASDGEQLPCEREDRNSADT